jgi:hypothetical protein
MKKIISTMIVTACAIGFSVAPVLAATTASFSPSTIKVVTGQTFNMVVSVNPNGATDYAEKVVVNYPADLLSVSAFNYSSNSMPLTQTGYDSIDNANGVMIKTAGYAGGIKSVAPFGTITFVAKKSGTANVSIGSGSQSNGSSVITGTGSSVTISSAVVPVVTKATVKSVTTDNSTTTSADLTPVTTINGQVVSTTSSQEAAAAVAASQAAASVNTSFAGLNIWLWILIVIIVLIGLYFFIKKNK